ncbi:MAG: DNA repair protein RecN [Clostridia bacterium]|nr:DNA repair protein RecN [Clostridia bacterium]
MLRALEIRDLALIEVEELEFGRGFHVLTGETGAGKSILVDALSLLLGGRASPELVRAGAARARVAAWLEPPSPEGEERLLVREVSASGRSSARIDDRPVTVATLRQAAARWLAVHGQRETSELLVPSRQRELLDRFGGPALLEARRRFRDLATRLREVRSQLAEADVLERERLSRLDLLRFQVREIEAVRLRPGEEEALEREVGRLRHLERLREGAERWLQALQESEEPPAVLVQLGTAARELGELARWDDGLAQPASMLEEAAALAGEAASLLRRYADRLDVEPGALEAAEERLMLLRQLGRKYGGGTAAILDYGERARRELESLEQASFDADALRRRAAALEEEAAAVAAELSRLRREAARRLEERLPEELAALGMPYARFRVALERRADPEGLPLEGGRFAFHPGGVDEVEFVLAVNPGEKAAPLAEVASGGELSRILLALETVLAEADDRETLVFDEVDAGVGGEAGRAVGERLARLGRSRQVVCVTHLASVAALADVHFYVEKLVEPADGGEAGHAEAGGPALRTRTRVRRLEGEERVREIARMLAGDPARTSSLEHARHLLRQASLWKEQALGA